MFMMTPPPPPPPPPQTNSQVPTAPKNNKKESSEVHPAHSTQSSNTVSNKSKELNERFAKSSDKADKN
jgi:hypothetical protein